MVNYEKSYEEGLIPKELSPDWGKWTRKRKASISELAQLTIGIEPNILWGKDKNKITVLESHLELYWKSNGSDGTLIDELKTRVNAVYDLAIEHLKKEGYLEGKGQYKFNSNIHEVKTCDYFDYLSYQRIPYPKELKECYRPPEEKAHPKDNLDNHRRIIAALLKWIHENGKPGQGFLSTHFSEDEEYKSFSPDETTINKIFGLSNKFKK